MIYSYNFFFFKYVKTIFTAESASTYLNVVRLNLLMYNESLYVTPVQVYTFIHQIWINIQIWAKLHHHGIRMHDRSFIEKQATMSTNGLSCKNKESKSKIWYMDLNLPRIMEMWPF